MITYTDIKTDRDYTLKELTPGIRHFVSVKSRVPTGTSRNGKPYYPLQSIEYYSTEAGDIELTLWLRLVEEAAIREGKVELLDRIANHTRENCAWLKSQGDVRMHAAECLCRKTYENWENF